MRQRKQIIAFVEDPGASNGLIDISETLKTYSIDIDIYSQGIANGYLKDRNIENHTLKSIDNIRNILKKREPDLVLVGTAENKNSAGLEFIKQARNFNIKTAGFVDAPAHADVRFSGDTSNPRAYAPDMIFVPDEITYRALKAVGFYKEEIKIVGNPYYDKVVEDKQEFEKLKRSEQRKIIFGDKSLNKPVFMLLVEPTPPSIIAAGKSKDRATRVLRDCIEILEKHKIDAFKILRFHPRDNVEEYKEYLHHFDMLSQGGKPNSLAYFSDVVVGLVTSFLTETAILGTPVCSVTYDPDEKYFFAGISEGLVPSCENKTDLEKMLLNMFSKKGKRQKSSYKFEEKASERLAWELHKIVK